jgi:site-specific DNA recombinase
MSQPPRAAIYARFSTDLQNERSTEDQIDLCRAYAEREGFEVVGTYADKARSGASLIGRDQIMQMLADAQVGKFDAIIVEALDRLSRDMEDLAGIHKRMSFLGIQLLAVHDGAANTLMVGLRGLVGQLMREDNVHKIRRGMTGLVKQGLSAGGRAYGYRPDPTQKGQLLIVEEEAEVVRYIFAAYDKGLSPRAICTKLNEKRIRPPRGELWAHTALVGSGKRGSGILRNPIYVGRPVWNKVRMVKDPLTGKRVSRPNPSEQQVQADIPSLRIIPDELFDAVQRQLNSRSHRHRKDNIAVHRRPKRLLSGLLKCGACGSGMSTYGHDKSGRTRVRCSAYTNSGVCPDPKTFYLEDIEALTIDVLNRELATQDQILSYAKAYVEAREREDAEENKQRARIEGRLASLAKDKDRYMDWTLKGIVTEAELAARMSDIRSERAELEEELSRLPTGNNVRIHPTAIKAFAERLGASLAKREVALNMLEEWGELSGLIRELIARIVVRRGEDGRLDLTLVGWLKPFIQDQSPVLTANRSWGAVSLVAEEGLEPPTRGL